MTKILWGPIVWNTLHIIATKIKDECFEAERVDILNIITQICSNLPCPLCASHAMGMIKKHKLKQVKSKNELITFIYLMHNEVNKRLNKNVKKKEILATYEIMNFKDTLTKYYIMNLNQKYNQKLMIHTFHKNEFLKSFYAFFNKNIEKFNQ